MTLVLRAALARAALYAPIVILVILCALSVAFAWRAATGPMQPDSNDELGIARVRPGPTLLAMLDWPERPAFQPDALIKTPLFLPTRRQAVPPPPVEAVQQPVVVAAVIEEPLPNYAVHGIVASPSTRMALLRRDDQPKQSWLAEGQSGGDGWVLSSVKPDAVVLSKGSRTLTLRLQQKRAGTPQLATR